MTDWRTVQPEQARGVDGRCANCDTPIGNYHSILCHALGEARRKAREAPPYGNSERENT